MDLGEIGVVATLPGRGIDRELAGLSLEVARKVALDAREQKHRCHLSLVLSGVAGPAVAA